MSIARGGSSRSRTSRRLSQTRRIAPPRRKKPRIVPAPDDIPWTSLRSLTAMTAAAAAAGTTAIVIAGGLLGTPSSVECGSAPSHRGICHAFSSCVTLRAPRDTSVPGRDSPRPRLPHLHIVVRRSYRRVGWSDRPHDASLVPASPPPPTTSDFDLRQ